MYSLLKETKTCQVCDKSFLSRKALGGHMRSPTQKLSAGSATSSTTSSFNKLGANLIPRETTLMRSVHNSEVIGGPKPGPNKECEQQATTKEKIVVDLDNVSWTDLHYGSPVEDVALCLIQIYEGKRPNTGKRTESIDRLLSSQKRKDIKTGVEVHSKDNDENIYKHAHEDNEYEDEDTEEDENINFEQKREKRTKFLCDICGKFLRSYQALGGHRTSHRNKRSKIFDKNQAAKLENEPVVRRQYKCQICNKVFESGQALGGHKKTHY